MTTFAEDLKTYVVADSTGVNATISGRMHFNQLPQDSSRPHIWYRTASDRVDLTLDKTGGLHEARYDLECIATSASVAQSLADAVKSRLHGVQATVGNSKAQGIFVEDADDSYEPQGNGADAGLHVVALDIRAFYTT